MFIRLLPQGFTIQNTEVRHAPALAHLQELIFPTLSPAERMGIAQYEAHIQTFPEGQFAIFDGERAIAMTTTMRHALTLEDHSFLEISGNMMLTTHDPNGDWLYGLDVGVLPEYRGKGLARSIYETRQELCRRLGLKGQVTVGMPNGYFQYADQMDLETYYNELVAGTIKDPTVSAQQKIGFQLVRLIHNYLDDPQCGNGGVLMVWERYK